MKECLLNNYFEFTCNVQTPSTGAATDADALPTWRVYEENNNVVVTNGNCGFRDAGNTTGYYYARGQITAAAGYEEGKDYEVRVAAIVGGTTGADVIGRFRVVEAYPLNSLDAVAAAVWDYLTAACTTIGSIGLLIVDYLSSFVAVAPVADGEDTIREDFDKLPFRRDITVIQNRTWEESYVVRICLHGGDAELIDFSEATTGTIRFKASDGTVTAEIALHEMAAAGNITARLTIAQTLALEAGRQRWEIYFKFPVASTQFPDGEEFSLFAGTALVKAGIPDA